MWVDSHCHLNFPDFSADLNEVVARAREKGVEQLLTICTGLDEIEPVHAIAQLFNIYCSVGVHPEAAADGLAQHELVSKLLEWASSPRVVGLGETGLDATYPNGLAIQKMFLQAHIDAARHSGLPLIIHSRGAEIELLEILQGYQAARPGVIHCFTGSQEFATSVIELGYYISVSGIITFKNAENLREVMRTVPQNRILVETDAPFLAPVPHRGKRNEPAHVALTGAFLAELLGLSQETLAKQTADNFYTLFNKASPPPSSSCMSQSV